MGLDAYANAFTSAGYGCVAFDYRRWGASGACTVLCRLAFPSSWSSPSSQSVLRPSMLNRLSTDGTARDSVFVSEQLEDYRTVIKWCRQRQEFDPQRIVVWGSSFSGAYEVHVFLCASIVNPCIIRSRRTCRNTSLRGSPYKLSSTCAYTNCYPAQTRSLLRRRTMSIFR
jgi:hypothetical protein